MLVSISLRSKTLEFGNFIKFVIQCTTPFRYLIFLKPGCLVTFNQHVGPVNMKLFCMALCTYSAKLILCVLHAMKFMFYQGIDYALQLEYSQSEYSNLIGERLISISRRTPKFVNRTQVHPCTIMQGVFHTYGGRGRIHFSSPSS